MKIAIAVLVVLFLWSSPVLFMLIGTALLWVVISVVALLDLVFVRPLLWVIDKGMSLFGRVID